MASNVSEKIIEIIAEQGLLDAADVRPERRLDELGIDSLGLVESIFAIEEAFGISVPFNANEPDAGDFDISTVASLISSVEKLVVETPE